MVATSPRNPLPMKRGDTFFMSASIYTDQARTTLRDLTDCTVECWWRHNDTGAVVKTVSTITDAPAGEVEFYLTASTTKTMAAGLWAFDIEVSESSAPTTPEGETSSSETVYMTLLEDVTNAV